MGLFSWLDQWLPAGYKKLKPAKNVWYFYMSYLKCGEDEIRERNLPCQVGYAHPVECWEIRPFAFIGGKKYRAKFKIVEKDCIIEYNKKKLKVPLKKCSFAYKFKYYHHKRINVKKRKDHEGWEQETPSGYGEYFVSVLVKD